MKSTGRATSFVTAEDPQQLRAIERLLGHAVPLAPGSPQPSSDQPMQTECQHRNRRPSSGRGRVRSHESHATVQGIQAIHGSLHR
jgi:ATP-dependent RNA helicase RhlE